MIAFLGNSRKYLKIALRLSIVTAAVIYTGTCVFTVGPSERAFIERFGRPLQQYDSLGPGLHLKLPWPVDRVIKINSLQSRQLFVGNVVNEKTFALLWTMEHGIEEEFLSGDNHFFFPYLTIQYHVSSVTDYHIHCVDPEQILDAVAHSHITRAFAGMSFESIVGEGRNAIETGLKFSIQKDIDELNAGIEIHGIYIRDIHPPVSIADAFEQVIAARQQKEQMINQAHGYRNQIIPEKRGEFDQKVERARAQSEQLVLIAGGDSGRFLLRCMPDPQSETLTRQRLYFDTMNCVLKSSQNMIVDPALDQTALIIDPSMKNLVLGNETAAQKPASKPVEIGNTAVQVSPETDTMGYYEREEY